jgi:hypothetical protein
MNLADAQDTCYDGLLRGILRADEQWHEALIFVVVRFDSRAGKIPPSPACKVS